MVKPASPAQRAKMRKLVTQIRKDLDDQILAPNRNGSIKFQVTTRARLDQIVKDYGL